jgi:hypothetical protein
MPDIDPNLIGAVVNACPIDKMVAAPLIAASLAHTRMCKTYADWVMSVGVDPATGKARTIQFDFDEVIVNPDGSAAQVVSRTLRAPILALLPHPVIGIKTVSLAFDLEISQSASDSSSNEAEGGFDAKVGWGPFSVTMHGKVSHKDQQTRSTDTRAKYHFDVVAERLEPAEGMQRILEAITNAIKPIMLPGKAPVALGDVGKDALPAPGAPVVVKAGGK